MRGRMYGKHRATVHANRDPLSRARLQVQIDERLLWAEGCFPVQGENPGPNLVPPVGTLVWVEFEGGDPRRPVYVGELYRPAAAPAPSRDRLEVIETEEGHLAITVDGKPVMVIHAGQITLSNGSGASISLNGPTISLNNGALQVT